MKRSIVWLASYPKSGNTWIRIFLANYVMNSAEPMPINEVRRFGTGDSVLQHYKRVARTPVDLANPDISLRFRAPLLKAIVSNNADVNIVKTHNIRSNVRGHDLIPAAVTRSSVYVMRNPLDMVLSYARHYGLEAEEAAIAIANRDNAVLADWDTVTQFMGTWSDHVKSWTSSASYPQITLRYEDLLATPDHSFRLLIQHLGMPVEEDRLARAIAFSSFKEVSSQEAVGGFGEKPAQADKFFGTGTSGHWREQLSPDVVKMIRRDHKAMMKKHGYWDD